MMMEIIKELTKAEDNENVTSDQILPWARRVEAHKAQSAIVGKLSNTKDFHKSCTRTIPY